MTTDDSGTRGSIADRVVDDYSGFKVYDERGEKLGKVEYTVLDDDGQPQYLGVNTGFFGTKTTLIPEEIVNLDDEDRSFSAQTSESRVKDAPTFDSRDEIDSAYEGRVRDHYGLGTAGRTEEPRREESASEVRDHDRRDEAPHHDESHREEVRHDEPASGGYDHGSSEGHDPPSVAASGDTRTERRDTEDIERRDDESRRTGRDSGEEREQVRVTLKREEARAERVIGADGEEEVRIRKTTVREETLIDVEDPK